MINLSNNNKIDAYLNDSKQVAYTMLWFFRSGIIDGIKVSLNDYLKQQIKDYE